MLEYISGPIASLSPTEAVIDAHGVGYLLNITVNTYSAIQSAWKGGFQPPTSASSCPAPQAVKLLVHEIIREDAHDLYGFFLQEERALFRLLIGVSGVGANTARVILSSLTPAQLQACITAGDADKLKAVKGIGLKTAQRIIVDLKDKITAAGLAAIAADQEAIAAGPSSQTHDEALAALVMLGYQKAQAQKALAKVFNADPAASLETAIKRALALL